MITFGRKRIAIWWWVIVACCLGYCFFFTPNFWLSVPVFIFPVVAFRLLWVDNYPNALFFGMILQWLSCATQLIYVDFFQITLAEKMRGTVIPGEMMDTATFLNIIGLYAFLFGLYFAVRKLQLPSADSVIDEYDPTKVLVFYIIISIVIYLSSGIIWSFPSVVQYFVFFFYIKWGFFVLTFYIVHKKAIFLRVYLYAFIVFEISLTFFSFFAGGLVNIILFSFFAIILLQVKLNFNSYFFGGLLLVLTVHYLILWSAVKKDYRAFISQGRKVQTVLVSPEVAQDKFFELMTNVDSRTYQRGIEELINRLGYIQFFAASLDYVPRKVPHQNGQIYLSAFEHYLVPRFLNPNKEVLDDSKHTTKYTGIKLTTRKRASSFSLGYIADAYVDFGEEGMHVLLLILGYGFGLIYGHFIKRTPNAIWQWIFTSPFLLLLNINGADTKKAIGWALIYFVTVALLRNQLIRRIDPLILK